MLTSRNLMDSISSKYSEALKFQTRAILLDLVSNKIHLIQAGTISCSKIIMGCDFLLLSPMSDGLVMIKH